MKKLSFFLLFLFSITGFSQENTNENETKMQWFSEAKLGIFIHWGIYAVNGIDESWSFYNGYISHEDYMKQLDGFTASNYKPKEWVDLIMESGAKYAVITTKHHDGVALWDSEAGELNVVKQTPAKKDLIAPFVKQLRKNDLKVGLYYSLIDWSYPDYPRFTKEKVKYDKDSLRWEKFSAFNHAQLKEISQKFNPDLLWFDGDWEHAAEEWNSPEIRKFLQERNPNIILNSRLNEYGDYATPEQGVPVTKPKDKYWELCMTMNDSWGYQQNDKNYKSSDQIIRIFSDCLTFGGNLLLDIAPKADGTIPEEQVKILKDLGRWTKKHEDAIYGSNAGIPFEYYYGPSTLSKDSTILYLFVQDIPKGPLVVKGLKNKVNRAWVVGNGTKLECKVMGKAYWSTVPGLLYIDVPEAVLDKYTTVIALLLDSKIELHR